MDEFIRYSINEMEKEADRAFKFGAALSSLDIILFILASPRVGDWVISLTSFITPIVYGLGGFYLVFCLIQLRTLFDFYKSNDCSKNDCLKMLCKILFFILAFVGYLSFNTMHGIFIPIFTVEDWV